MSFTKPFPSKNVNDTNDCSFADIFTSPSKLTFLTVKY